MHTEIVSHKPKIKIFVSHRTDLISDTIDNPVYVNVRCGAIYDKVNKSNLQGDDTGDNISYKKPYFSELTVMYWAWKNQKADYYGLCHYRRYMSFSKYKFDEDIYGNVVCKYLDDNAIKKYGFNNDELIYDAIQPNDFIFTTVDVSKSGYKNVYQQYKEASFLNISDLDVAIRILKKEYPEFSKAADKYFSGKIFYPCLMFVMKKNIFDKWCSFIFNILNKTEKAIDVSNYGENAQRTLGHIAERLFGVFITYLMESHQYHYQKAQRVLVLHPEKLFEIQPFYSDNDIPIVLTSSDWYIPYLSISLESLCRHASTNYNYDIIILNVGITKRMKELLLKAISSYNNVHITFYDVSRIIDGLDLRENMHIGVASLYRLLIPQVCKKFTKILYLDSDIVVCDDVSKLYDENVNNMLLAAVHDVDYCGEYNGGNPIVKKICLEKLKLKKPYDYFNAGVLLINVTTFNQLFKPNYLIEMAQGGNYIFMDQDVLNVVSQGKVKFLDFSWNVLHDCFGVRINQIISQAPLRLAKLYFESRKNPKIVHYAGGEKPWVNASCDFSEIFWKEARQSIFYEMILQRMAGATCDMILAGRNLSLARRIADRVLPKGSRQRELLKKVMPRGSRQFELLKKMYHKFTI